MRILIVEDEMLVATDLEATLEDLGHVSAGIAPDTATALALAAAVRKPELALVDLNLRDGPTGLSIAAQLAERGIGIVFVTANPSMVGAGVPGALGIVGKPCDEESIEAAVAYALRRREGADVPLPSTRFSPFRSGPSMRALRC